MIILTPLPPAELLEQFRQVRPVMGTGYESILIVRMLMNGETVEEIMTDYSTNVLDIHRDSKMDIDELKALYGKTRDEWINEDLNGCRWI